MNINETLDNINNTDDIKKIIDTDNIDVYDTNNNIRIYSLLTEEYKKIIKNDYQDIELIEKYNKLLDNKIISSIYNFNILPYLVRDNKIDIIKILYPSITNNFLKNLYEHTIYLFDNDLIKYIYKDNIDGEFNKDIIEKYKFNIDQFIKKDVTFNYVMSEYNDQLYCDNEFSIQINHNYFDLDDIIYNEDDEYDYPDYDYPDFREYNDRYDYDKRRFTYNNKQVIKKMEKINNEIDDTIYNKLFCISYYYNNLEKFNENILLHLINNDNLEELVDILDNNNFRSIFIDLMKNYDLYNLLDEIYNLDMNKNIFNYIFNYISNINNYDRNIDYYTYIILKNDKYKIDIINDQIIEILEKSCDKYLYDIINLILNKINIDEDLNKRLFEIIINGSKDKLVYLKYLDYDLIDGEQMADKINELCEKSSTDYIYHYTANFIIKYMDNNSIMKYKNIYDYYNKIITIRIRDIRDNDIQKLVDKFNYNFYFKFKITRNELDKIIDNFYPYNYNTEYIEIVYNELNDSNKDYFYNKFFNQTIINNDLNTLEFLYNDKHKWLDSSLSYYIQNLEDNHFNYDFHMYEYLDIFKFMMNNGIVLEEYLFKIIYDNYNNLYNNIDNYNTDLDSIYQEIITICLDYIFNSNNNFIINNNQINEYYQDLFLYSELISDLEFFEIHREELLDNLIDNEHNILKLNVFNKHKIIKHIIDKKYYNNYECLRDYILDYIDGVVFYNDNNGNEFNGVFIRFNILQNDDDDSVFISLKNYLINNFDNTFDFVRNLNVYMDLFCHVFNNNFVNDVFKRVIIDGFFNKELFLNLFRFNYNYIFNLISEIKYYNTNIFDFLLDYYCDYIRNIYVDENDIQLNIIIKQIIDCIDSNYKVLFDEKYGNIFTLQYFDRVNFHIIEKKYYITDDENEYLINKLLGVILNIENLHEIYRNFMNSVI